MNSKSGLDRVYPFARQVLFDERLEGHKNIHISVDLTNVALALGVCHTLVPEMANLLLDSVLDIQKERRGSTLVSSFSTDFFSKGTFSATKSPTYAGLFAERALQRHNANRGLGPIFSFISFDSEKRLIPDFSSPSDSSFGPDSIFDKLISEHFDLISIGHHYASAFTIAHHFEELLGVDYRFKKTFVGAIRSASVSLDNYETEMFVRAAGVDFSGLTYLGDDALLKERVSRVASFDLARGKVLVFLCDLQESKNLILNHLQPGELLNCVRTNFISSYGGPVLTLPNSRRRYLEILSKK